MYLAGDGAFRGDFAGGSFCRDFAGGGDRVPGVCDGAALVWGEGRVSDPYFSGGRAAVDNRRHCGNLRWAANLLLGGGVICRDPRRAGKSRGVVVRRWSLRWSRRVVQTHDVAVCAVRFAISAAIARVPQASVDAAPISGIRAFPDSFFTRCSVEPEKRMDDHSPRAGADRARGVS